MNYDVLKARMDKFFDETSSEDIVKKFEDLGYSFIGHYDKVQPYSNIGIIIPDQEELNWLSKLFKPNKNKKEDLDKFEVFFCKIALC